MSGPPRTPTQIRRAKGNPGKRAYNKREPKMPAGIPDPPPDMAGIALGEWKRLAALAHAAEVLTKAEGSILELAARAYATFIVAERAIERHGLTYETTNQNRDPVFKSRPEVAIASDAWRRYRAAVCELGFTPAARAKVSTVAPSEDEDPATHLFN